MGISFTAVTTLETKTLLFTYEDAEPWNAMHTCEEQECTSQKTKVHAHYQNRTDDLVITSDTLYH
jgi:hypothetical protein